MQYRAETGYNVIQSNPIISRAINSRKSVSRACTLDPKF